MAVLTETEEWVAGVYQLEVTDPVLGGAPNESTGDGMSNIPHLHLANRTVWLKNALVAAVPPGAVQAFAMATPPEGWLECDGSTLSRITFANLFAAIGETFGAGDGSTTFAIPDLRGEFLRGWDNGRGVDASRVFGSAQGDAIRDIVGTLNMGGMFVGSATGAFTIDATTDGTTVAAGSSANDDVSFAASNVVPTAGENRPRNVAMMFCIRF